MPYEDDEVQGGPDEGREFLRGFLLELRDSTEATAALVRANERVVQSNVQVVQVHAQLAQSNAQLAQSNMQLVQLLGHVSAQLDGLAQRIDLVDARMAWLGEGAEVNLPAEQSRRPPRPVGFPSVGQALRGVAGFAVDQLMQGQDQRGGGRRRRR